jgi:leader peptidase (prepilin peptidase)/N-methyltransferase
LSWVLLVLTLIDLRYLEVPDAISLPLIAAGLAATWWLKPQAVLEHAVAAACAAVAIWLLGEVFRRLRGIAGIGGGDVRLFAAAGACVGLAALPGVVFLSGIYGLLAAVVLINLGWVTWRDRIPFVPAISAAIWTVFLMPELMRP